MTEAIKKKRSALFLALLASVLAAGAIIGITGAFSESAARGVGHCIKPQRTLVADGPVPGGQGMRWSVFASLRSDRNCEGLALEVKFRPDGTRAGSWRSGFFDPSIDKPPSGPYGGSEISAQDEVATVGRVFSGFVSSDVSSVRVNLDDGSQMTIRPRSVSPSLRRKFPWLREIRYFVHFYPRGSHAREVILSGSRILSPVRVTADGGGSFEG